MSLRTGSGNAPPRLHKRTSSIDKVPQLVGQLNSDGIASLQVDPLYQPLSRSNPPRSLKTALDAVATDSRRNSSGDTQSETSEEDYDNLKHDPAAVVGGGKGGGYEEVEASHSMPELNGISNGHSNANGNGLKNYEALKTDTHKRPGVPRLKSIPVTLNKLKEKGRYILTADDEALREILKSGLERVGCIPREIGIRADAK